PEAGGLRAKRSEQRAGCHPETEVDERRPGVVTPRRRSEEAEAPSEALQDLARRQLAQQAELLRAEQQRRHRDRRDGAAQRPGGGRTKTVTSREDFRRPQRRLCRPIQHLAGGSESRAMARAVPALRVAVPAHDASEVGADGGAFVQAAVPVAIYGDLA